MVARVRRFLDARLERSRAEGWFDLLFVPAVLLVLVLYLSLFNEFFLDGHNLRNIFLQGATLALVAFGVTFVILAGELDLSVGATVALVSVVSALVMKGTGSIALGVLAGLATGALVGVVNGLIVTVLQVPSFIATLGTMVTAQGAALAATNGTIVAPIPSGIGTLDVARAVGPADCRLAAGADGGRSGRDRRHRRLRRQGIAVADRLGRAADLGADERARPRGGQR